MEARNLITAIVVLGILEWITMVECSIRCYQCLAAHPLYVPDTPYKLCKDFDYSESFIVDCPHSTFCMKQITSAHINNVINATARDCAKQKRQTKNYLNGSWVDEIIIEEPYTEGCEKINDKGARTSNILNCYCKEDLCNSSDKKFQPSHLGLLLTVMILLLINFPNV